MVRAPMRLCFISPYPPSICGIADYTYHLTKALLELNPDMRIDIITEYEAQSDDDRVVVYPSFDIISALERVKPRLVHIQHSFGVLGSDDRMIRILEVLRKLGARVVVTFHTVHSRETVDFEVKGYDIEEYNRIICSSSACVHTVHT